MAEKTGDLLRPRQHLQSHLLRRLDMASCFSKPLQLESELIDLQGGNCRLNG
jgi:hypothetical protein